MPRASPEPWLQVREFVRGRDRHVGCNSLRVMTDAGLDTESARSGPRERLMLKGEQALSDAELLAIVLGTGTHNDPVGVVAQRLLDRVGGLVGLQRAGLA